MDFERSALLSALRNHCLWAEFDPKAQSNFDKGVLIRMVKEGLLSCDDLRKLKLDKIIYPPVLTPRTVPCDFHFSA